MKQAPSLTIDLALLEEECGSSTWARGRTYARDGRIEITSAGADQVKALVQGTETYWTAFQMLGEELVMDCSCPAFAKYHGPCKHLVALAITLTSPEGPKRKSAAADSSARLHAYLRKQPLDKLVELVLDAAEAQPDLKQRLTLQADTAEAEPAETARILKKAITAATQTRGFVDYRRMPAWANKVDAVLDHLRVTLDSGRAPAQAVLELVPYLVQRLEKAVENCDDDGHIGFLLDRSAGLLFAAAKAAQPEGAALARLLQRLDSECAYFKLDDPISTYADVLGEAGQKVFVEAIESEWQGLKVLRPDDKDAHAQSMDRRALTNRRLELARVRDDVEMQIETLAKTLVTQHHYLKIVELCQTTGRNDQAKSWIEEALWLFEEQRTNQLVETAAEVLAASGEVDRALALLWEAFVESPSLSRYRRLTQTAKAAGRSEDWPRRCLDHLEEMTAAEEVEGSGPRYGWAAFRSADVLIEIHLSEERLAEAWAIAKTYTISPRISEQLACASESARPAEAAALYEALAETAIKRTNRSSYEEACEHLGKASALRERAGQIDCFADLLADLRRRHKAKRTFMALLAEQFP